MQILTQLCRFGSERVVKSAALCSSTEFHSVLLLWDMVGVGAVMLCDYFSERSVEGLLYFWISMRFFKTTLLVRIHIIHI